MGGKKGEGAWPVFAAFVGVEGGESGEGDGGRTAILQESKRGRCHHGIRVVRETQRDPLGPGQGHAAATHPVKDRGGDGRLRDASEIAKHPGIE